MTTAWWQMLGCSCQPPCPCILDCPQLVPTPRLGRRAGQSQHRRQDDDPGGLRPPLSRGQALAGGDCIDDTDALRAGRTARVLDCVVKAPSPPLRTHTHLGYPIWQMVFHRYPFRRTRCFAHVTVKPSRLAKWSPIQALSASACSTVHRIRNRLRMVNRRKNRMITPRTVCTGPTTPYQGQSLSASSKNDRFRPSGPWALPKLSANAT